MPSDSIVLEYCDLLSKRNDYVTCIDCLFDTLDYAQWKNDYERWHYFEDILSSINRYKCRII